MSRLIVTVLIVIAGIVLLASYMNGKIKNDDLGRYGGYRLYLSEQKSEIREVVKATSDELAIETAEMGRVLGNIGKDLGSELSDVGLTLGEEFRDVGQDLGGNLGREGGKFGRYVSEASIAVAEAFTEVAKSIRESVQELRD